MNHRGPLVNCLTLLALLFLAACQSLFPAISVNEGEFAPVITPSGDRPVESGLHITADPRIELLAVVQFLGGYDKRYNLITDFGIQYKTDVEKNFRPYRDHLAVNLFDQMSASGFSFDAPPAVMLYLSNPPGLEVQAPFSEYLLMRTGGPDRLGQFISALRDFARESNFMDFYEQHAGFYAQIAEDTASQLPGQDDLALLEDYYGMKQGSYNIILAPLFHNGGFGPHVERPDGLNDIYSIIGPNEMSDGLPHFGTTDSLRYLIWHEFAHSFVNPTTETNAEEVAKYAALFNPIQKQMKDMAYPNWETSVNEHIVRAVTVRLAAKYIGEEESQARLDQERQRGFAYIDGLVDELERYETQREQYPAFTDFYPELLKVFSEASQQHEQP